MGVEYYLVNAERKCVLDIHKAYWLAFADVPEMDAADHDPDGYTLVTPGSYHAEKYGDWRLDDRGRPSEGGDDAE